MFAESNQYFLGFMIDAMFDDKRIAINQEHSTSSTQNY
jgi:hypothetical protein